MRVVEGRSGSGLRVWIGVLVAVLMVAAFTPAVLSGSTMSAKSQTMPTGVSSKAVVLAGAGHFAPPHSDSGYDANGNGLFDFLLVNASVQITAPGNFTVYGTLHNANNTLQIYNSTSVGLPAGPANLTVWFDGRLINQSGIDGPYTVDLVLVNENFSLLDFGTHTTQPYSHLDFDPMPAFMTPPHPDSGQDTNGNGLFDFLNVDVQVQANVPANYSVSAFLHTTNSTLNLFAFASVFLPIGPGSIQVSFPGGPINQSGIDGPYTVELQLYESATGFPLGMNTTTTQAYSHLDFDPTPAFMSPPHPDSGQDTNGNGLFDILNVDVQVQVNLPGNYTVNGFLYAANFSLTLSASGSASLPVGPGSIRVSFPGWPINQSGIDGPYTVELTLFESGSFAVLGTNITTTQAYSHLAFDPIPAVMTPPHPDSGQDINGNGLFDFLNVDVHVQVNLPDNYTVNGFLYKGNSTITSALGSAFLPIGPGSIQVSFPSGPINQSGIDGPYTVELTLFESGSFAVLGTNITTTQAYSHLAFDAPAPVTPIQSSFATATPTIDGVISSGEWNDSTVVNLTAISGNTLPAYLLVKNNDTMLYMAYDAIGDTTQDPFDIAALAFDTGNDAVASNGHEDQFDQGATGFNPASQSHWVYSTSSNNWSLRDAPYNQSLPNEAGLESAWGFAASPGLAANHRSYEFAIPLALLASGPGQTLGFFGGSQLGPGVGDGGSGRYSLWPVFAGGPIPLGSYGDLILASAGGGDTTPPTIAINSPASGAIIPVNSITLDWSASDSGTGLDHFELTVDGGAPTRLDANATGYTVSVPSDGSHTIQVTAFDGANNFASASVTVTVDTTSPVLSITYPGAGAVLATGTVAVAWAASDATSGLDHFELSLDGGAVTVLGPTEGNHTFAGLSQGSHTATLVAFDLAGHTTAVARSFTVDTTAPSITLSAPTAGYLSTGNVLVTWAAADNNGLARIEVSLDGGAPIPLGANATSTTLTGVSDGLHTIRVQAFDLAGSSASDSVAVTVDTTAPTASLSAPTPGQVFGTSSVQLTWTASDATSGVDHFEVRLDGATPINVPAGTATYTFTSLSDGTHTLALRAFDRAGNTILVSATVTVDTVAPIASLTAPTSGQLFGTGSVQLTWTASDATSGIDHFEVRLDGGTPVTVAAGTTEYTFTGVSDGTHTLALKAFDRAGNTVLVSVAVSVDGTAPTLSVVGPASGAVVPSSTSTVTWTAGDATSGIDHVEIRLDGGSAQTLSSGATSYTLNGLSDGTHTVNVTVVDQAGHSSSKSVSFRVDTSFVSPSGPYGIVGLTSIIVLVVVALLAALLIIRRRRRPRAPT